MESAFKVHVPRLGHLFFGGEASSRRVEKRGRLERAWGRGEGRVMEPKTSGSFWVKGPDGPAACRAGGGGVQSFSTFIGVCSHGSLAGTGPLLLLSASSPPPALML